MNPQFDFQSISCAINIFDRAVTMLLGISSESRVHHNIKRVSQVTPIPGVGPWCFVCFLAEFVRMHSIDAFNPTIRHPLFLCILHSDSLRDISEFTPYTLIMVYFLA